MSRIIEAQMNRAIYQLKNFSKGNTRVEITDDGEVKVFLHGHNIAKKIGHRWHINLCGWNSNTTRSRLSALLREFCGTYVATKQGQAYLGNEPIDSEGWYLVP